MRKQEHMIIAFVCAIGMVTIIVIKAIEQVV